MNETETKIIKSLLGDSKRLSTSVFSKDITVAVAIGKSSYDSIHLYTDSNGYMHRVTINDDNEFIESIAFKMINEHDHVFGQECYIIPELSDADSIIKLFAVFNNLELKNTPTDIKNVKLPSHNDMLLNKEFGLTTELKETLAAQEFAALALYAVSIYDNPEIKAPVLKALRDHSDMTTCVVNCLGIKTAIMELSSVPDVISALKDSIGNIEPNLINILTTAANKLELAVNINPELDEVKQIINDNVKEIHPEASRADNITGKEASVREQAAANLNRLYMVIFKDSDI
ncbi:hypothetical protein LMH73_019670 [Vibrio splendidus]|nr:hypothetical protein [Vibrio splendidus]MCC4882469.1 hypothetical protein [Vibrio splendidus]